MGAGFRALLGKLLGGIGMLVVILWTRTAEHRDAVPGGGAQSRARSRAGAAGSQQRIGRGRVPCAGQCRSEHFAVLFARERRAHDASQEGCRVRGASGSRGGCFAERAASSGVAGLPVSDGRLRGGPGELAYFAQSQVIYDRLLGRMPVAVSRASFTLLDARTAKLLARYGLALTDTLVPEDALKERIAHVLIPEAVAGLFERHRRRSQGSWTGSARGWRRSIRRWRHR